jgi:hypothetical protein
MCFDRARLSFCLMQDRRSCRVVAWRRAMRRAGLRTLEGPPQAPHAGTKQAITKNPDAPLWRCFKFHARAKRTRRYISACLMKSFFHFSAHGIGAILLLAIGLMISACNRKPPLEQIVAAPSDSGLMMWKADVAGDFTRQEWQDFDAAVQEIKYGVMIDGEASGSAGVWTATLQKLDGLSVREVLKLGLSHKLERITQDREKFAEYVTHNEQVRVRPGDEDSVDYLRTLREHQDRRIALVSEQIRATEEILQRRGITLEHPVTKMPKPAASNPF